MLSSLIPATVLAYAATGMSILAGASLIEAALVLSLGGSGLVLLVAAYQASGYRHF